jgi:hypothetical protein
VKISLVKPLKNPGMSVGSEGEAYQLMLRKT